jgi:hypothetical protein
MEKHKKVVVITAVGLVVATVISIAIYGFLAPTTQNILLFYLIVISAWTSFAGVAWALYLVWVYQLSIHKAKAEIDKRLGGPGFAGGIAKTLEHAQKRFSELTPEQRERILNWADKMIDMLFEKVHTLGETAPTTPPAPPTPPPVPPSAPRSKKPDAEQKQKEVNKWIG